MSTALCTPEVYVAVVATIVVGLAVAGYIAGALDARYERRRAEKLLDKAAEYDEQLARKQDAP